jgi:formate hydrogenlyase subunit 4
MAYLMGFGQAVLTAVVVLALAPLLEGSVRKLLAVVHSRKGPPITQPYLDLLKLLGKEDLRVSNDWVLSIGPPVYLGALLVAVGLAPLLPGVSSQVGGDVVVFIYFLSLSALAMAGLGFAGRSPYSAVGASREVLILMAAEPVVAVCLLTAALRAGTLTFDGIVQAQMGAPSLALLVAAVAFLLILQVQVGKLPFDMVEAESEIMDGPLTEISGPQLALCKWGMMVKQFLYSGLFIQIFVPWIVRDVPARWAWPLLSIAYVFIVNLVAVGVVHAVNPRLRIDQAMRYAGAVLVIAILGLAYAAMMP